MAGIRTRSKRSATVKRCSPNGTQSSRWRGNSSRTPCSARPSTASFACARRRRRVSARRARRLSRWCARIPSRLQLAVPERSAGEVRAGQIVRVTVEGRPGRYDGRVVRLSPSIEEGTRTLAIEHRCRIPMRAFGPGTFARADIIVSEGPGPGGPEVGGHRLRGRGEGDGRRGGGRPRAAHPHGCARGGPRRGPRWSGAGTLVITNGGSVADGAASDDRSLSHRPTARHAQARRHLHRAAGVRRHDHPGAGGGRRRLVLPPRRRPLSGRRPADVMVRTNLPGASVEEMETQVSESLEEAVNHVEGINELRSISGAGSVAGRSSTFNLDRDIDAAAQDVRDRVGVRHAPAARRCRAAVIQKQNSEQSPSMAIALSGNLSIRELTEIADKTVKVAARAVDRRRRGADRRRAGARRSTSGSMPIVWPPTGCRSRRSGRPAQQNADVPGGNVTTDMRRADAAHDGPLHRGRAVQRSGGRDAQRRSRFASGTSATPRTAPRSSARSRASNGVPTVVARGPAAIGREHRRGHRGGEGQPRALRPQLPAGVTLEIVRDQSTHIYAALHEINVHLVLGSILACLVVFAFMRDWRATMIAAWPSPRRSSRPSA